MLRARPFLALALVTFGLFGCGGHVASDKGETSSELVAGGDILGFETPAGWSISSGSGGVLTQSTTHVQGRFSLGLTNKRGYTEITSGPIRNTEIAGVASPIGLSIRLPTQQINPFYFGAVQLYFDIPSRNIFRAYVGQVELTGLPTGTFKRIEFPLSTSQIAMLRETYPDLAFKVAINVPVGETGTYLLDALGPIGPKPARVSIATAVEMTCALNANDGVECWGGVGSLQFLGDGSPQGTGSAVPVQVAGLTSGMAAVAVGAGHACALTNTRQVYCWGQNPWGELGDGTTTESAVPVLATLFGSNVAAVVTGFNHTCALTFEGAVLCAGFNGLGEVGNGTFNLAPPPVKSFGLPVQGLGSGVIAITALAEGVCALTTAHAVLCWGGNSFGQLGDGTSGAGAPVPTPVQGLSSGVMSISGGSTYACALTNGGVVLCWGSQSSQCYDVGPAMGFTGTPEENCDTIVANSVVPVAVSGLPAGILGLGSGPDSFHECAYTSTGIFCWGNNRNGELGNHSTVDSASPVQVSGITSGVTAIAPGFSYTCATVTGRTLCWGGNEFGKLGTGDTVDSSVPLPVIGL